SNGSFLRRKSASCRSLMTYIGSMLMREIGPLVTSVFHTLPQSSAGIRMTGIATTPFGQNLAQQTRDGSKTILPSPLGGEGSGVRGLDSQQTPRQPLTPTPLPRGERGF